MPTYNRHELFAQALNSLISQSYDNFEIFLLDNGSTPPIEKTVRSIKDPRIVFRRFEINSSLTEIVEEYLNVMTGTHFVFIGDDDAFTPHALEIIAATFYQNKNIEMLSVGCAKFNHITNKGDADIVFDNILEFDAKELLLGFCSAWGIGPAKTFSGPRKAHPSASFISKELIDKTRKHQKQLFVRPFGDVGYLGCCLHTSKAYYLDLPLVIIGDALDRDSQNMAAGKRKNLENYAIFLEYSPLRGITFANLAVESHLQVLYRNNLDKIYDCKLRPRFYYRHFRQIISDKPWTLKTVRDIKECIIPFVISTLKYLTIGELVGKMHNLLSNIITQKTLHKSDNENKKASKSHARAREDVNITEEKTFSDINEFAVWIERNYIKTSCQITATKMKTDRQPTLRKSTNKCNNNPEIKYERSSD